MIRRLERVLTALLFVLCLMLFATPPAPAQDLQTGPKVIEEDYHDTSIPISEMAPPAAPVRGPQQIVIPLRRRPWPPIVSPEPDAVSQNLEESPLVSTTNKLNFNGASANDDGNVT